MAKDGEPKNIRVRGDFNGLFRGGAMLCLSHGKTCKDENGNDVVLHHGMKVTAFDPDIDDEGNPADLVASGTVHPSPDWLQCRGSKWVLMIDEEGVYHESDLRKSE
jgi:hypothetical protein